MSRALHTEQTRQACKRCLAHSFTQETYCAPTVCQGQQSFRGSETYSSGEEKRYNSESDGHINSCREKSCEEK